MKKLAALLVLLFVLFGCSDGGSSDNSPSSDGNNLDLDPVLLWVDCYEYSYGEYTETEYLNVGDWYVFEMSVMDFDMDITGFELTIYKSSVRFDGPNFVDLPKQDFENMTCRSAKDVVDFSPGEYTLYFKLVDSNGNKSNSYSIDITILEKGELSPDEKGTAPWAAFADMLKYAEGGDPEYENVWRLNQGDQYVWEINARDDEMDIDKVRVTLYSSDTGYGDPEIVDLPKQTHNPMYYQSELMTADMPIGEYKYYFTFIDAMGNESDEFYELFWIEE